MGEARGRYYRDQVERYNEGKSKEEFKPFAEALNTLMEERGLTGDILAKEIDISKSAISQYLSAKSFPKLDVLEKIRVYFGVSYDYLLGASKVKSPDPNMQSAKVLLGLSEDALKYIASAYEPMKEVLESLLCSAEGRNLLSSCAVNKLMYSNISERMKEYNLHPGTREDWYIVMEKLIGNVDSLDVMMFRLSRNFEKWSEVLTGYEALRSEIERCHRIVEDAETDISE